MTLLDDVFADEGFLTLTAVVIISHCGQCRNDSLDDQSQFVSPPRRSPPLCPSSFYQLIPPFSLWYSSPSLLGPLCPLTHNPDTSPASSLPNTSPCQLQIFTPVNEIFHSSLCSYALIPPVVSCLFSAFHTQLLFAPFLTFGLVALSLTTPPYHTSWVVG